MKYFKMHLLNILKGVCIGIANVIPGFSGGTMAVMLNIYDLFVYAFANIFNDFINVLKKSWSLFVGIALGILFALVTISKLLELIPFITIMFFVGLILGSIPQIYNKTKEGKLKIVDIISFIIAIVIIVILPFINTVNSVDIDFNIGLYIIMFSLGIICASAMVIPGVSGSLVLMAFGYYKFLMSILEKFLFNVFNFNLDNYLNMLFTILSFALGCVIGLVFVSKLITFLTKKYPKTVFITILGLLVVSPFSVIYSTLTDATYSSAITFDWLTIIFSIISCILGIVLVLFGEKYSKIISKKEGEKE